MNKVRAKKHLGQHFLNDENIAFNIVDSLQCERERKVLEVGPGMGVLTKYLLQNPAFDTWAIDLDQESIEYLHGKYPALKDKIVFGDFLRYPLHKFDDNNFTVIGNFPYNISSQIFFKVLDHRDRIDEVVGMIQKEVADRIASPPGSKVYGILSVFLQAFYKVEYLFTVHENVFIPPPKVKSAVLRLTRNNVEKLECNEKLFFRVVKMAFNQRRKTMRNSLKQLLNDKEAVDAELLALRPEQLGVDQFIKLTQQIELQLKE